MRGERCPGARSIGRIAAGAALVLACGAAAWGSGGPENALLIIDPNDPASMYVGNYYRNARNIPEANVLYLNSGATNYQAWVNTNQAAFLATLDQRAVTDHIDYVVLAPLGNFFVNAPGLLTDGCSPVTRFSIGSVYTMSFISGEILPGGQSVTLANRYYSATDSAQAFDSSQTYLNGVPSTSGTARRYYIAALLGYTAGVSGNTVPDLLANIDRSVAIDGTRPLSSGTFYYMNNPADPNRNVRQPTYATAVSSLGSRGANALQLTGVLPPASSTCLGIMGGFAQEDIPGAGLFIRPGAFCDHLTSYAATFDIGAQTKVSAWIANGASGSAGAVEEPCNYTGKFPHARLHVWYVQGLTLGESYLRSVQYVPFQGLLYGDPLTRPFAYIPTINVTDAPPGTVAGTISLTPTASTSNPGATVTALDLLVDGALTQSVGSGQQFTLNTATLNDGYHDLRVVGRDNSFMKIQGRWVSTLTTSNFGRSATLGVAPASGNLAQAFVFSYAAAGAGVREVRLVQNGRVVAAGTDASGTLSVFGQNLGAGASQVQAEAIFTDGRRARSAPVSVTVSSSGEIDSGPLTALSYTKYLLTPTAYAVELPAAYTENPAEMTYTLLSNPTQATVLNPTGFGAYRIIRPNAGATGSEQITFRVSHAAGGFSNVATLTLVYSEPPPCPPDWNHDGTVNSQDFFDFLQAFFAGNADYNHSGQTNSQDYFDFITAFFLGC